MTVALYRKEQSPYDSFQRVELFMCTMLTECSNGFAQKEYNVIDKIAETEDRYAKENSVFNPIDGGYSLVEARFDGWETLWAKALWIGRFLKKAMLDQFTRCVCTNSVLHCSVHCHLSDLLSAHKALLL